jgi:PhnB protein
MELEPYLHFSGNCEEALNFYKGVFGGEFTLNRFEGSPLAAEFPPDYANKIMHANFTSPSLKFMAADGRPASTHEGSGRISLSLGGSDVVAGKRVFDALAAGGTIVVPFQKMFWGATFGQLTDKFGIEWMVNCGDAQS